MVSVGNHEYDYPTDSELDCGRPCGENDPSGAGASWHPSWWDGLVDSEGECGVGTFARFRSPGSNGGANGNAIFWYSW